MGGLYLTKDNPETRSKIMQSIKAVSKLESMVSHELWNRGYRFRRNVRSLKGTPDIAIKNIKSSFSLTPVFGISVLSMEECRKAT